MHNLYFIELSHHALGWGLLQPSPQLPVVANCRLRFGLLHFVDAAHSVHYRRFVFEVRQTIIFRDWFRGLHDVRAHAQIVRRMERAQGGNLGDTASVGEGVREMRIHHGPGYRLYFVQRGQEIIFLLTGGNKSSQSRDIEAAIRISKEL